MYRYIHTEVKGFIYKVSKSESASYAIGHFLGLILWSSMALVPTQMNQFSTDGNPTLCTSVVVPGGLPHAIPISATPKIHIER
jgi:hypothetical protein